MLTIDDKMQISYEQICDISSYNVIIVEHYS